ncbi:MAG: uroporphyrinogen decarboxylase family protein [bacterium]|nr:uroporphyrinogen decarboxylase family protein [bacterium]
MTGRERLIRTLLGQPVDRPAVNFYEVGGLKVDPNDPDPFNVYNDPSWQPLLQLAEEHTDLIRMRGPALIPRFTACYQEYFLEDNYENDLSYYYRTKIKIGGRELSSLSRRDKDIDTVWILQHIIKDLDDLKSYLDLPDEALLREPDLTELFAAEKEVGDKGIVMVDIADPLCLAASLFDMSDYTVIALTEQKLFHALLEKCARHIYPVVEKIAAEFPDHLWRICGAEYATEPYLPPRLFKDYVVRYTGPMIDIIKRYGGLVRIHCHGRMRNILRYIAEMGVDAIDPIEPTGQGDIELDEVRREYGRDLVLFGNLEITDIENMEPRAFETVVRRAIKQGTYGSGRGFVLMPSASPIGRKIRPRTLTNYETIVKSIVG